MVWQDIGEPEPPGNSFFLQTQLSTQSKLSSVPGLGEIFTADTVEINIR